MLLASKWALTFAPDNVYRVQTDDGAAVALGRYAPRGERRFAEPVILCHGLGVNRFLLDFDEQRSLARHLARAGFESWVLELRGRGLAGHAGDTDFDEQAEHDVSAALRAVLSGNSLASQAFWVGHSKGGLLALAHLGRHPEAPIKAVVALGSPMHLSAHPLLERALTAVAPKLPSRGVPFGTVRAMAGLGIPVAPFATLFISGENTSPEVFRRCAVNATCDIATGVVKQFARWIGSGAWDGNDGFDYRQNLERVRAPVMLVAGTKDLLAPPSSAFAVVSNFAGPVETLSAEGYGHGDLVLGKQAPSEIFGPVERFLCARATPV